MANICNKEVELSGIDIMKIQNIIFLVAVLGVGIAVDKFIHAIIFSIPLLILKNIIDIEDKDSIHIYAVKSVLIFLITVLCANIIDIDFYKSLLFFYSIVSMIGINILGPLYKKHSICDESSYNKYKRKVFMISIGLFITILLSMTLDSMKDYITYIISPIFIIYIILIVSIVKENIILD